MSGEMQKCFYGCLPGLARVPFAETALRELAAIMQYTEVGQTRPWCSLDRGSKIQWLPHSVAGLYDSAPARWKPWVLQYGWREFSEPEAVSYTCIKDLQPEVAQVLEACCHALLQEAWVGTLVQKQKLQLAPASCKTNQPPQKAKRKLPDSSPGFPPAKSIKKDITTLTARELSQQLLKNYPYRAMAEDLLDLGQVLRGCIAVAKNFYGDGWPQQLSIGDCGDLASWKHQSMGQSLCGLLYSQSHWALLVIHDGQGMVYDGKLDKVCWNHATAFVHHLTEQGYPMSGELVAAKCPRQEDTWSCGHRAIACLDLALEGIQQQGIMPSVVTDGMLSAESVQAIIGACARSPAKRAMQTSTRPDEPPCTPPRTRVRQNPVSDAAALTPPRPDAPHDPRRSAMQVSPAATDASTPRCLVQKASKKNTKKAKMAPNKEKLSSMVARGLQMVPF